MQLVEVRQAKMQLVEVRQAKIQLVEVRQAKIQLVEVRQAKMQLVEVTVVRDLARYLPSTTHDTHQVDGQQEEGS